LVLCDWFNSINISNSVENVQKIAIFGGTFNPVHWGHLLIAETAFDQFSINMVLWVPASHPPHKTEPMATFEQRLTMIQRAIADQPVFQASAIDQQQPSKSYAITTLQNLREQYPQTYWYWILGADAFRSLPKWRGATELAEACTWLVAPRPDRQQPIHTTDTAASMIEPAFEQPLKLRWHPLQMPVLGVSSSLVRDRCRQQKSIRYLVPETVRLYIETQKLYIK
jgi:nicotinate-nucleotide adenylyltransferase